MRVWTPLAVYPIVSVIALAARQLNIATEGPTFFRPDLLAVRQRLTEYEAIVAAVTGMIASGAPIGEIRAAYKRLRLEIKIAHADATRRADDLTQAERAYWQRAITAAARQLLASAESNDTGEIRQSLCEARVALVDALSTIEDALRS